MTVVIFAQDNDSPVDKLVLAMTQQGIPVFRADLSWFPQRLELDAEFRDGRWHGTLSTQSRAVELSDINAIWYRDPSAFRFAKGLSDAERSHAHLEARLGLGGVLASLPVLWVNYPNRAADAMYKPLQLLTATKCGLTVPRTLVTNRPEAVSEFAARSPNGVVGKTFGANTVTEDGTLKVVYTYRLRHADFNDLRGIATTAHQIQDWVEKKYEARVVVVGGRLFGVTIHAHSESAHIDWRTDFGALTYEIVDVPDDVDKGLQRYMTTLGLSYAAFDFCIDQCDRWIFLESNSGGQYSWLEEATGAPINQTLIELLADGAANA